MAASPDPDLPPKAAIARALRRSLAPALTLALAVAAAAAVAPAPASASAAAAPSPTAPAAARGTAAKGTVVAGRDAAGRPESVTLDAASSEVDYKSNTVVFRDIVVSQGDIRVAADQAHATGLNFDDSEWTFSGKVRINVDGGSLASDKAIVSFRGNRIARATITGDPAEFQQQRKGDLGLARGRAGSIEYDVGQGTVRLSRDAWLTDGRNEITGQELVYDIVGQRVKAQASEGDSQRVHITIRPRGEGAGAGAGESPGREPPKP